MPARDSGPPAQRAREISQGLEELPACNALVRPVAAVSDLDQALLRQEIAHGDANRHAQEVIHRDEVNDTTGKALLKRRWAGAVDTVGGHFLATALKSTWTNVEPVLSIDVPPARR